MMVEEVDWAEFGTAVWVEMEEFAWAVKAGLEAPELTAE